jgi:hypothetical protein
MLLEIVFLQKLWRFLVDCVMVHTTLQCRVYDKRLDSQMTKWDIMYEELQLKISIRPITFTYLDRLYDVLILRSDSMALL